MAERRVDQEPPARQTFRPSGAPTREVAAEQRSLDLSRRLREGQARFGPLRGDVTR